MYEGYLERLNDMREMAAWHISWVTAPHVKKPLKMKQILPKKRKGEMQFDSEYEKARYLKRWVEERRVKKDA